MTYSKLLISLLFRIRLDILRAGYLFSKSTPSYVFLLYQECVRMSKGGVVYLSLFFRDDFASIATYFNSYIVSSVVSLYDFCNILIT